MPSKNAPPQEWFEEIVKAKQMLLVATMGTKIVGFRMGERITGDWAIAHLIAVHPAHQHKGIGARLVRAFEDECKKRGLHGMVTYVHNSPAALHFFKKQGYIRGSTVVEHTKLLDDVHDTYK